MSTGGNWAEQLIHQDAYAPHELAELLDMSEAFILQEVHNGNLEGRKIGDNVVDIPREAVLKWMERRERGEDDGNSPIRPPS